MPNAWYFITTCPVTNHHWMGWLYVSIPLPLWNISFWVCLPIIHDAISPTANTGNQLTYVFNCDTTWTPPPGEIRYLGYNTILLHVHYVPYKRQGPVVCLTLPLSVCVHFELRARLSCLKSEIGFTKINLRSFMYMQCCVAPFEMYGATVDWGGGCTYGAMRRILMWNRDFGKITLYNMALFYLVLSPCGLVCLYCHIYHRQYVDLVETCFDSKFNIVSSDYLWR